MNSILLIPFLERPFAKECAARMLCYHMIPDVLCQFILPFYCFEDWMMFITILHKVKLGGPPPTTNVKMSLNCFKLNVIRHFFFHLQVHSLKVIYVRHRLLGSL